MKGFTAGNAENGLFISFIVGVTPSNNFFLDTFLALVGQSVASGYALYMDWLVRSSKRE